MTGKVCAGVEELSILLARETGSYGNYLNPDRLPYLSRDNYIANHPEHANLTGESTIIEKIEDPDKYGGIMVYGDGGIGKTRLIYEIGHLMKEKGWGVYVVSHQLESLSKLKDILKSGDKFLLIFDSIEEHPLFTSDLVDKLGTIAQGTLVKIAANCRNIYYFASSYPQSKELLTVELTLKGKEAEVAYNDYVVENILGESPLDLEISSELYLIRPAFAVFFRYLQEKFNKGETQLPLKKPPIAAAVAQGAIGSNPW